MAVYNDDPTRERSICPPLERGDGSAGDGRQRIEGGEAVEEWQIVDMLGMLQQLGVVEPPSE